MPKVISRRQDGHRKEETEDRAVSQGPWVLLGTGKGKEVCSLLKPSGLRNSNIIHGACFKLLVVVNFTLILGK